MKYCTSCGEKLEKEDKYCSACGKKVSKATSKKSELPEEEIKNDINENKGIAILSYLGILAVIPYFMANNSKFAMYHAKQGMNLMLVWILYGIIYNLLTLIQIPIYVGRWYSDLVTPWYISLLLGVSGGILLALSIMGIVNVCNGKEKELPVVGKIKIIN